VVDEKLAPAREQVGERPGPLRAVEEVRLVHPDPRQLAPLPAQLVGAPGLLLFPRQQREPGSDPLFARDHAGVLDGALGGHVVLLRGWWGWRKRAGRHIILPLG